ncbi:MAG: PH domain-containing protein [Spirulinaceae cyanobacterium RM2_2_10]|nr:PH domain-containing protein [Spirulinaceae cyanobacterium SM2_1_0]NJO19444.1 PH domain-containing protein [Spirulinaceae cyanobacterium RM2_2_10]
MVATCQRYPSKRDTQFVVCAWLMVGLWGWYLAGFVTLPEPWLLKGSFIAFGVAATALLLWILYGTHYILGDRHLLIRCGPLHWQIELDAIHEIAPTQTYISSAALSLDRLLIAYQRAGRSRVIAISPQQEAEFLTALAARSPGLEPVGDRIWRRQPTP